MGVAGQVPPLEAAAVFRPLGARLVAGEEVRQGREDVAVRQLAIPRPCRQCTGLGGPARRRPSRRPRWPWPRRRRPWRPSRWPRCGRSPSANRCCARTGQRRRPPGQPGPRSPAATVPGRSLAPFQAALDPARRTSCNRLPRQEPPQILRQVSRRKVALLGVVGQGAPSQAITSRSAGVRGCRDRRGRRLRAGLLPQGLQRMRAAERRGATHQGVEDGPQGVDVHRGPTVEPVPVACSGAM